MKIKNDEKLLFVQLVAWGFIIVGSSFLIVLMTAYGRLVVEMVKLAWTWGGLF